jgi:phage-related protein
MKDQVSFDWGIEFDNYLQSLDEDTKAFMLRRIKDIQQVGIREAAKINWISQVDSKTGIYEIRARTGSTFPRALYFRKLKEQFYITSGFNKKTNKTPVKEIKRSIRIKRKFKSEEE